MNEIETEETIQRLKQQFAERLKARPPQQVTPDLLTLGQAAERANSQHRTKVTAEEIQAMLDRHPITRMYARKVNDVWYMPENDLPTLVGYVKRLLGR